MSKELDFTAYVRKEGRMTVPKGVRDALGIREGDLVNCTIGKVKPDKTRNPSIPPQNRVVKS